MLKKHEKKTYSMHCMGEGRQSAVPTSPLCHRLPRGQKLCNTNKAEEALSEHRCTAMKTPLSKRCSKEQAGRCEAKAAGSSIPSSSGSQQFQNATINAWSYAKH